MNKKRVILIDPEGKSSGPNVSLAYINAYLKSKGIKPIVLDFNNLSGSYKKKTGILMEEIRREPPLWIGYSLFYTNVKWAIKQIRFIRNHFTGKIVVGGPQAILEHEELLKEVPCIDILCTSEGEQLSFELTEALISGTPLDNIPGIVFREPSGSIVRTRSRPLLKEIDMLPFPDFSFYERPLTYYPILTSRGCPFECAYCFRAFSHDWRPRTAQNVTDEILAAKKKYKFNKFVFHDDSFNLKPQRVIEICNLLIKHNINMPWSCAGIRSDHITEEMANKTFEAGCEQVNIGIETFDHGIFQNINKRESLDDIITGIRIMQKSGVKVSAYLIIGLPGDTYEKTMENMKKAKKLKLDRVSWTIFLPIPKTKYHAILKNNPLVRWLDDYRDIDMVWLPRMKKMGVAFELPEYTAKQKIDAYRRVNACLLTPLSHHQDSILKYLLHTNHEMMRYAPTMIFRYWFNTLKNIVHKFRQGTLLALLRNPGT